MEDWNSFKKLFPSLFEDELKNILSQSDPSYREGHQGTCSEVILRNYVKGNISSQDFSRIKDCLYFAKACGREEELSTAKTIKDYERIAQNLFPKIPVLRNISDNRIAVTGGAHKKPRYSSQFLRLKDFVKAIKNNAKIVFESNRFIITRVDTVEVEKLFCHSSWCIKDRETWEKHTAEKFSVYAIFDKINYDSYQFSPHSLNFSRFDNKIIDFSHYKDFEEIKDFISNLLEEQKMKGYNFYVIGGASQIILYYFMDRNVYHYIKYEDILKCVSDVALKGAMLVSYIYSAGTFFDVLRLIVDSNYGALNTLPERFSEGIREALQDSEGLKFSNLEDINKDKILKFFEGR